MNFFICPCLLAGNEKSKLWKTMRLPVVSVSVNSLAVVTDRAFRKVSYGISVGPRGNVHDLHLRARPAVRRQGRASLIAVVVGKRHRGRGHCADGVTGAGLNGDGDGFCSLDQQI